MSSIEEKNVFFDLYEYVDTIKLSPMVLEHLEETNYNFNNYMKKLLQYDEEAIIYFWLSSLYKELSNSCKIEQEETPRLDKNTFFGTFKLTKDEISSLHKFVTKGQVPSEYRLNEVKVSGVKNGEEVVHYYPPKPELVPEFMESFIDVYKTSNNRIIHSNPFIKSALIHFLFIRVHPFSDGNGRTARLLYNLKFTELINKMYDIKLELPPLNVSQNLLINKISYCNKIDNVPFNMNDIETRNAMLNKYFDFMLYMADEQLYFVNNKIEEYDPILRNVDFRNAGVIKDVDEKVKQMKLGQMKP